MKIATLSFFSFWLITRSAYAMSELTSCPPAGLKSVEAPDKYKERGPRFEGRFVQPAASSGSLRVVSYASGLGGGPVPGDFLRLAWNGPKNAVSTSRVRALSLRQRHYYRMDVCSTVDGKFDWPTDQLRVQKLDRGEIGLLATARVQAIRNNVYLPIQVESDTDFRLLVEYGATIKEVYLTLRRVDSGENRKETLPSQQRLKGIYFAGGHPFELPLPRIRDGGIFRLDVAVVFFSGGSRSDSINVYLPSS